MLVKSHLRAVMTYPVTWIAVVLTVVVVLTLVAWFDPPPVMTAVFVAMGAVGAVSWPLVMAATGVLERRRYSAVELLGSADVEPVELEAELTGLADPRPLRQLEMLRTKRDNLAEILNQRLDSGELTFSRYVATADRVYQATLQNLREAAIALKSLSAFDTAYVDGRLEQLDADDPATSEERATLESRRGLHDRQAVKATELLALNESALTSLDATAVALADAPMGSTPLDAERAMAELDELARRAALYSS